MKNGIVKLNPVMMDLVHYSQLEKYNPFKDEIFLIDVLVALRSQGGIIREHVDSMSPGEELELVRVDGYNIWIKHQDFVIGEIPLENGIIIARLMDAGKQIKCKVSTAGTHDHKMYKTPFSRVLVKLYMGD